MAPQASDSLFDLDDIVFAGEVDAADIDSFPDDSLHWGRGPEILAHGRSFRTRFTPGRHTVRFFARYGTRIARQVVTFDVYPGLGHVLWVAPLDRNPYGGLAMNAQGTSYTVDGDFRTGVAIRTDGTVQWRISLGVSSVGHPAAIGSDGTVYWGYSGSPPGASGENGGIVAVSSDGTIKWYFQTRDNAPPGSFNYHVHGGVAIDSAGTLYFGSDENDGPLYAVHPDGTLKWRAGVTGSNRIWGYPALVGDTMVIVVRRDDSVAAYATETGELRWMRDVGSRGASQKGVAIGTDGTAYTTAFVNTPQVLAISPAGNLQWARPAPVYLWAGAPLVSAEYIYLGSLGGGVAVLNLNGDSVRAFGPLESQGLGGITVGANGVVYAVTDDRMVSYDSDGRERFSVPLGHLAVWPEAAAAGPVIAQDGTLYYRANVGVVAVRDTVGPAADAPWPTLRGNDRRTGQPRR